MVGLGSWRYDCSLQWYIRICVCLTWSWSFFSSPRSLSSPTALACLQADPSLAGVEGDISSHPNSVPQQHCCHVWSCPNSSSDTQYTENMALVSPSQRAWKWSTKLPSSWEGRYFQPEIFGLQVFGFLMNSSNFLQKADTFFVEKICSQNPTFPLRNRWRWKIFNL